MRALLQRVLEASVTVDGARVGEIGQGLLVFLGVGKGDGDAQVTWMSEKISVLRVFKDDADKMNRSVLDTSRSVLLVSQFTLYADTRQGRRPSFTAAAEPAEAMRLYELCAERLRRLGLTVSTGVFAADMKVALVNDGPVTLWLDSEQPPV